MVEGQILGRWDAENLHHIDKDLGLIARKNDRHEGYLSVDEVLELSYATRCRDPRDKVYGLLAVMEPDNAKQIAIDYVIEPSELFINVSELTLHSIHQEPRDTSKCELVELGRTAILGR